MRMLRKREVSSVMLFEVEVSQDELELYESCTRYVLENFDEEGVEKLCGAYRDELLGMCEDISNLLKI